MGKVAVALATSGKEEMMGDFTPFVPLRPSVMWGAAMATREAATASARVMVIEDVRDGDR